MMMNPEIKSTFAGTRVLLVEDNFLVGLAMKTMLMDLGCDVTGPVATVDQARSLADSGEFSAAVLDINIIGGTSAPVALALASRGCPYFFVTGFASSGVLPESFAGVPRFRKPIDERALSFALHQALH